MQRELVFQVGDTITGAQFKKESERSQQNLLNTSLFNFVTISPSCIPDSSLTDFTSASITINVKERWYTWPAPIFEVSEQNFNTWWRNGHNLNRASYGFFLWRYNFRGRKESIALICRFGYAKQFGGQYAIPFFDHKHRLGVTFTGTYTRSHEISYDTQDDKLVYYKDKNGYIRGETAGSVMFSYRKGLYVKQTLDLRYNNLTVSDTVTHLASDYFVNGKSQMEYFSVSYHLTRDYRDIKAYPLKGHFEELEITKYGLGILADEKLNVFYVTAGARTYNEISPRFFFAGMVRGRWMPGNTPPYYQQRAMGFSDFVRGYEYYVVDGQSYALTKASLRYAILKPHKYKFPYLPVEKFNTFHLAIYGGIFADAGYVEDRSSSSADHNVLGNTLLFGYGAGIDVVTYYDFIIRFEYSFNRMGENGFFLHLGTAF